VTGFLLDTNVISEFSRAGEPDRHVDRSLKNTVEEFLFASHQVHRQPLGCSFRAYATQGNSAGDYRWSNPKFGLIAAAALDHDLTLVTRNVKDFAAAGVRLFNPWDT
jgi:predicted nucleic acid-binding protein